MKTKRKRPALKPRKRTTAKHSVAAKRKTSPVLCSHFACKKPATTLGLCEKHKLTADDVLFRQRMQDTAWMVKEGLPAIRKLLRKHPKKTVATKHAMV